MTQRADVVGEREGLMQQQMAERIWQLRDALATAKVQLEERKLKASELALKLTDEREARVKAERQLEVYREALREIERMGDHDYRIEDFVEVACAALRGKP